VTWDLELARRDYHRVGIEAEEHLAIVEAMLESDAKAAASAMAAHMRSGVKYWSQVSANLIELPNDDGAPARR
jgi:DNA-binding GntR family transcriptional regulator